jgi:hypothetical protein
MGALCGIVVQALRAVAARRAAIARLRRGVWKEGVLCVIIISLIRADS